MSEVGNDESRKKPQGEVARVYIGLGEIFHVALTVSAVFLGVQSVLTALFMAKSVWRTSWVVGAIFMGQRVLRWPAVFDFSAISAAFVAVYPVWLVCVILLACFLPRSSTMQSLTMGAAAGAGAYMVVFYGLTHYFPWLIKDQNWYGALNFAGSGIVSAWLLCRIAKTAW